MNDHTACPRIFRFVFAAACCRAIVMSAPAVMLGGPLALEDEGSFFVNGQSVLSNYPGASLGTGAAPPGNITVNQRRNGCVQAVKMINGGGGRATFLLLSEAGIPGNSYMLMMDRNNLQVAGLIRKWIGENVR